MSKRMVRYLSLALVIFIFSSSVALGQPYSRNLSVDYDGFILRIDGAYIELNDDPFMYDNKLYIPVKDVLEILGLDVVYDSKQGTLSIDTKGLLNFEDESKPLTAMQLGYEIDAIKREQEYLKKEIQQLMGASSNTEGMLHSQREPESRSIRSWFNNIKVTVDGKSINTASEPFVFNNKVYMWIEDLLDPLYLNLSEGSSSGRILDISTNGVLSVNKRISPEYIADRRNSEITKLYSLTNQLNKEAMILKKLDTPYRKITSLTQMEKYINEHLNKLEDISMTVTIHSLGNNKYQLISYFSQSKVSSWNKLDRRDIENWVESIHDSIRILYDSDAKLSGSIRNPYYNIYSTYHGLNYATFDTRDSYLSFDFTQYHFKENQRVDEVTLASNLNKNLTTYNTVGFEYEVVKNTQDLDLIVSFNKESFKSWHVFTTMSYLNSLRREVDRHAPGVKINGKVFDSKDDSLFLRFGFEDGLVKSRDLLDKTEEHLNIAYGTFVHGNTLVKLDYAIYETEDNMLDFMVKGDFAIGDDTWIRLGESGQEALKNRVQSALGYILHLWNRDISVEVLDKNSEVLNTFDIYRNNTLPVYASPTSGNVPMGTAVMLRTDTSGARIYYTIDGSTPTTLSNLYTGPIVLNRDVTIKTFAYRDGMASSGVSTFEYRIDHTYNISDGLSGLTISAGQLTPVFNKDRFEYSAAVANNVESINITPRATVGKITVNGTEVQSSTATTINLNEGLNAIVIVVKEDGKEAKTYRINVTRGSAPATPEYRIANLDFSKSIVGIFSGRLESEGISDFTGYKIQLLSKSDVKYSDVTIGVDGTFEIIGFDIGAIAQVIGYKYKVYGPGPNGSVVLEGDL